MSRAEPATKPISSDREVLAGLVERVTFHNAENGFCVLRTKARGHRELVTVVCHAAKPLTLYFSVEGLEPGGSSTSCSARVC
jgi:hypothetical protein